MSHSVGTSGGGHPLQPLIICLVTSHTLVDGALLLPGELGKNSAKDKAGERHHIGDFLPHFGAT